MKEIENVLYESYREVCATNAELRDLLTAVLHAVAFKNGATGLWNVRTSHGPASVPSSVEEVLNRAQTVLAKE